MQIAKFMKTLLLLLLISFIHFSKTFLMGTVLWQWCEVSSDICITSPTEVKLVRFTWVHIWSKTTFSSSSTLSLTTQWIQVNKMQLWKMSSASVLLGPLLETEQCYHLGHPSHCAQTVRAVDAATPAILESEKDGHTWDERKVPGSLRTLWSRVRFTSWQKGNKNLGLLKTY